MRSIAFKTIFLVVLFMLGCNSAWATIENIKGTLTCSLGCNRTTTQYVAQGEQHQFEVFGQFVDLSTGVEVVGLAGVTASYGTRKSGNNSSIIINFVIREDAAPGDRTIRMRYIPEINGPDTFTIRVVKKGTISQVQWRRQLPFTSGGKSYELVEPTGMPLNQRLTLEVSGTRLDNTRVLPFSSYYRNVEIVSATANAEIIQLEFSSSGQTPLYIVDPILVNIPLLTLQGDFHKFRYSGGPTMQFGNTQSGGGFTSPQLSSSTSTTTTFVDVAPRVNMLNIFRRQSQTAAFTENGAQYFSVNSEHCNGMSGDQSRIITIPNPVWGVTNVGTAPINLGFNSQLRSGGQNLAIENITTLNPAETKNFNFVRQNSRVRVFTFLLRGGCFVSPTADDFFEDQPFTVVVNLNNTLNETAANTANNSRNY